MKLMLFLVVFIVVFDLAFGTILQKAKKGETTILPCPSDDKLHRFQYWQLQNDQIVGPWNNHEGNKFRYEVWSGRLIIKGVSDSESGFYKCFSKQILGSELKSETVELVVVKDLEESYENHATTGTVTIAAGAAVLLILMILGIMYFMKRRNPGPYTGTTSHHETRDDRNKNPYRPTSLNVKKPSTSKKRSTDKCSEDAVVETDITTSFSLPN